MQASRSPEAQPLREATRIPPQGCREGKGEETGLWGQEPCSRWDLPLLRHFMWLNLVRQGCVSLQDPRAKASDSQIQPSLPQGGARFVTEYLPGGPTRQVGVGPNQPTPCQKLPPWGSASSWGSAAPRGQPLPGGQPLFGGRAPPPPGVGAG